MNTPLITRQRHLFLTLLTTLAIAFFCLILKDSGHYFSGKFLWAEDGNIFMNQAYALGFSSLWKPYSGYLHLYARIFAWVGHFFSLRIDAVILFLGWLFAFSLMIAVMTLRMYQQGLKFFPLILLVILITLQPNDGKVFFNITDAQWMLGGAFFTYLLITTDSKPNFFEIIGITIVSLTGPFSIIVAPTLVLRGILQKDFIRNAKLYFIIFSSALIQGGIILYSGRISGGLTGAVSVPSVIAKSHLIDANPIHWIQGFLSMVSLGASNFISQVAMFLFWILLLSALILTLKNKTPANNQRLKSALLLLLGAVFMIISALCVYKASPQHINTMTRYGWLPYILIVLSAVLISIPFKKIQGLIFVCVAIICVTNFQHINTRINFQFPSYVKFSNYHNVSIPINPSWPLYPSWHIERAQATYPSVPTYMLDLSGTSTQSLNITHVGKTLAMNATRSKPTLTFLNPIQCPNSSDVGVEVSMTRKNPGWVQLFWSDSTKFTEQQSLNIYYPAGKIKAQFAFPNNEAGNYIGLSPMDTPGTGTLQAVTVYCLP